MRLNPKSGNPLNQLAVVATYKSDYMAALAYYYQSLCCVQPFQTAQDNLSVLFQKNKKQNTVTAIGESQQLEQFKRNFVNFHSLIFENEKSELFLSEYETITKQLESLLLCNQVSGETVKQALIINIAACHSSKRKQPIIHWNIIIVLDGKSAECLVDMTLRWMQCILSSASTSSADLRVKYLNAIIVFWLWCLQTGGQLLQDKIHKRLMTRVCQEYCKVINACYLRPGIAEYPTREVDAYLEGFVPVCGWFAEHRKTAGERYNSVLIEQRACLSYITDYISSRRPVSVTYM